MKDFIGNNERQCSACKKKFSMFLFDTRNYVYKIRVGKSYIYQCSYPCHRKEMTKYDNERSSIKE